MMTKDSESNCDAYRCYTSQLSFALEQYADAHAGHYPTGKERPAASLSLLHYYEDGSDANVLRGKTVPEEMVQAIFDEKGSSVLAAAVGTTWMG